MFPIKKILLFLVPIIVIFIIVEILNFSHYTPSLFMIDDSRQPDLNSSTVTTTPPTTSTTSIDPFMIFRPDTDTYYTLDVVRKKLVNKTQESAFEMAQIAKTNLESSLANNTNITRGIMGFLPANNAKFLNEFRSFYLSVALMRSYQPPNFKTDILIFTPTNGIEILERLGCTLNIRTSFEDNERCTIIEHTPLADRKQDFDQWDPLKPYHYIDSILILSEFNYTSVYDFILRTDLDTFITPGFGEWLPPSIATVVVGSGGYGSQNANNHLKWVAKVKLGLINSDLINLGSTWFGESKLMSAIARTTVGVMRWLQTQEFSEYEKCCNGVLGWPNWHWHVILLYGGHIALNHLGPQHIQMSAKGIVQLDGSSTSSELLKNYVKHIHCWHTSDQFSKFKFQDGGYSDLNMTDYLEMNTARDYATVIAVSSSRLSDEELKSYISNQNLMKDKKWARPIKKTG